MKTCYDCIHCDACSDAGDNGFSSLKEDVSKCKHFKNKADFVEVVRCKDCEHYSLAMLKCCLPSDDEHSFDNYAPPIWQPNDFCSYGTPKERGGEK